MRDSFTRWKKLRLKSKSCLQLLPSQMTTETRTLDLHTIAYPKYFWLILQFRLTSLACIWTTYWLKVPPVSPFCFTGIASKYKNQSKYDVPNHDKYFIDYIDQIFVCELQSIVVLRMTSLLLLLLLGVWIFNSENSD